MYSRRLVDLNIWRVEVPGRGQAGRPTKFISSTLADAEPQFSPDGRRIVFSSNQSGSDEIWVCDSDGSKRMQLTSFNGPLNGSPRWSPDSKQIAFDARVHGQFDIYVLDADGGKPRRLTTDSAHDFVPAGPTMGSGSISARPEVVKDKCGRCRAREEKPCR